MDTFKTRWLLYIVLANLQNYFALAVSPGPPAPPSPKCFIPIDENDFSDIICTWDSSQGSQINYSLHWKPASSEEEDVITGSSLNGVIHRDFSKPTLLVWVQAENQYGSAKSEEVTIDREEIIKPPPPEVTSSHEDISWNSICDRQGLSVGECDVRHRSEADHGWREVENGYYGSYTVDNPQPCTVYEFQVRCRCNKGLMSNWSEIHRVKGTERTPVGELNVWRDCGVSPAIFDCVLTWKRLPESQACGLILGYEVEVSYSIGTVLLMNVSTAEPGGQLVCDLMQCYLTQSLKDASSVSVSAYNAHGATVPSYLAMPAPGKEQNEQTLHVMMDEENLTVSWELPSQLSDNLKEYVVQYKQAGCPPGQSFDWVKVNKSETTAVFTGHFKKYTAFEVSLFTVSHSNEIRHLLSEVGYSDQKTPSKVLSFSVVSIADTHVTLLWEPLPLSKQNGVILYYQIGVEGLNVYDVKTSPQHENKTFQLQHLKPGQEYDVWIRAVTVKGPGEITTTSFRTKHPHFAVVPVLSGIICAFVICTIVIFIVCQGQNKVFKLVPCYCDKVPDPRNSHIFREMKHQDDDPMSSICIPILEQHPKISYLEIVEIRSWASKSSLSKPSDTDKSARPVARERSSQMDCQDDQKEDAGTEECHRMDPKNGRKAAYSKMIDSDEERHNEEEDRTDCWSSSEEEQCTTGYEKHFMPTALEILEVL